MVDENDSNRMVIVNIMIVVFGLGALYFIVNKLSNKKQTAPASAPRDNKLPETITINGTTIPTSRVMTNGKFDNAKFNALFEEVKANRAVLIKRQEEEGLEKLNKDVVMYPPVLDMKVYDVIQDYEQNVRETIKDIVNGENWTKGSSNRQLYFGVTLIMLSLMYFVSKLK